MKRMSLMKISEFSKRCHLSRESIRYYVKKQLILPQKVSGYYNYDAQCLKDIRMIVKLRQMAFSLDEIRDIMKYLRLERDLSLDPDELLMDYFESNLIELETKRYEIIKKELILKREIETLKTSLEYSMSKSGVSSGIKVELLSSLICKKCHQNLELKKGKIKNDKIIEGILQCSCGIQYEIHEGFLFCEGEKISVYDFIDFPPLSKE